MLGKLGSLIFVATALASAASWSGALVDSRCYQSEENNVNPHDTLINVDRDRGLEIRFCSPGHKTKSFAVVDRDGLSFKLDAGGNTKAADLVQKTGKKPLYIVALTGEKSKDTVKVGSISLLR